MRIISETFHDADGNPVDRDSPDVATAEVVYLDDDGQEVRAYLERVDDGGLAPVS